MTGRKLMTYGVLVSWGLFCLFPVYWLAVTSLKTEEAITTGPHYLPFVDFTPSISSWSYFFYDRYDNFLWQLANSLLVSVSATVLTLITASMALYGFTRFRWRLGGTRLVTASMLTRILPTIVLVVPVYTIAQRVHLTDTRTLLILIYTAINLPVALWLLRPVLGSRASEQEESALLDGASHWRILFEVLLPSTLGGLVAASAFVFILSWNEYLLAASLATDHAMTLPTFLASQMSIKEGQTGSEAEEWSHFSAAAVFIALPPLILLGAAQRALSKTHGEPANGLTASRR